VTGDSKGVVKFWRLKGGGLLHRLLLGRDLGMMRLQVRCTAATGYCTASRGIYSAPLLQRESGLLGIGLEDFGLVLVDIDTRTVVRFQWHRH
jgi:hypothetical protein